MTPSANWSFPTAIRFGAGRIIELAEACVSLGMKRPLLVTDRGLASLPITAQTLDILETGGFEHALFAEVDPNPNEKNLAAGLAAYAAGNHDGIIAFGGGSGIDLAKMIAFMCGQTRPVWDFEDIGDWWTRADADKIAPIIAIPTTAGTGSEVGRASVLTNSETHQKKIIFHPKVLPSIVISDPELTVGMPPMITAGTGMDAFAHCLEAYCSPHFHPMAQGIALEGMKLVKDNLVTAYTDGTNIAARSQMLVAATMGATAFMKGLGAIHALSHPIGAHHNTHHGTTNAVVMQPVLRFNEHAIKDRLSEAAAYLGISGGYGGFYDAVGELNAALHIPDTLTDLGVTDPDMDALVAGALSDPSVGGNPVEMTEINTRQLLESCF
ncbi:iron-containing alcohol dehydrogenase [Amylibacter sp. IMCC11727]|uniref:iron-containing alcohol dehydrogenase n=1 Tax=Amylibacter sp. IMCC11727 TaxID=3039851 RepID=UPI00244DB2CF|nr:iron-containing alcohol dehydrogenase [Amylibacter sp. IMCC11727]WGI21160.1 iron-containing alcohol dehydrogenase [Amylibacter sp. IMCC11727]